MDVHTSSPACALPGTGEGGILGPLVVTAPLEEAGRLGVWRGSFERGLPGGLCQSFRRGFLWT